MLTARNIDRDLTERLRLEVLPLLPPEAAAVYRAIRVYVCRRRRGQASHRIGLAVIPSWVFNETVNYCSKGFIPGGPKFAAYYLAHELAHVKARVRGHGPAFYEAFKALCPPELQHYEGIYKPRAARMAGVKGA